MMTSSVVKRVFGSFHSSNLQSLIELSEEEYKPPEIPVSLPSFTSHVPFGSSTKKEHFLLDDSWTFINHGAFGAALKQAMEAKWTWQVYVESQPLRFLDREILPLMAYVIRELAKFIDSDPSCLVLVPNVTHGNNTVVKCIVKQLSPGDRICSLNINYGSTKKLLNYVSKEYGIQVDEISITFPVNSAKEILDAITNNIHPDTKLAIFDHISSNYGIILPVEEIIKLCHERGVKVLIDGAHAPGSLNISMRDIGADFYVGNAHKWLCCPKGCAFLYVNEAHRADIRPFAVSHGYGHGFLSEFSWIGLMDYSSYFALLTVLEFWKHYGTEVIRSHIHSKAREAALLLMKAWGTSLLADINMFGSMVVVALPNGVLGLQGDQLVYDDAEVVQDALYYQYKIEVPIKAIQGKLYVRISFHMYNEMEDYEKLADAISELTQSSLN